MIRKILSYFGKIPGLEFSSYRAVQPGLEHQIERLRLLESVVVHGNDAVLITTAESIDLPGPRIVYCNSAFTSMTGYTEEDVIGLTPRLLQSPKTNRNALDKIRVAIRSWASIEIEVLNCKKDGTEFWVELSIVPVANESGYYTHWVSVQRNISDRKASEETAKRARLAEAENMLLEAKIEEYQLIEADLTAAHRLARLGTWRIFADRNSMYWSEDVYAMLGLSASQVTASVSVMLSVIYLDDRVSVEQVLRAEPGHRPPEQVEFRVSSNNHQVRYCRIEARSTADTEAAAGIFGFCQDITRQKETEHALLRTERLKTLGQLTGGVAHDFNNLLLVTMLNLEQSIFELPSDHPVQVSLDAAMLATTRGAELTSRLLAYARRIRLKPQLIDLAKTFGDVSTLLGRTLGVQFILTTDSGLPNVSVYADPSQLENALMNLVINSRDAMPSGGLISIVATCREIQADSTRGDGDLRPGRYGVIDVTDQGVGIEPEVLARVFEPFFTTKPPSDGSGLGLSMVYGFAQQSNGHVSIASTPAQGTTVSIFLPAGLEQLSNMNLADAIPRWTAGGLRALIVEDQPAVLDAVTRMMTYFGFQVTPALNANVALSKLDSDSIFDLLFSDIVLPPPMSGTDLAVAARKLAPNMKILLTSGYADDKLNVVGDADYTAFLPKPYGREILRATLSKLFIDHVSL